MNKKSGEITLLTERQQAVFAAPFRESELQTTQHTTDDSTHYRRLNTLQTTQHTTDDSTHYRRLNTLQTTQHTTPPTKHKQIIIYSKAVEDFKHFATETSVALLLQSVSKWL